MTENFKSLSEELEDFSKNILPKFDNTQLGRAQVISLVQDILNKHLPGDYADYQEIIICDETNNTYDAVEENRIQVDIHIRGYRKHSIHNFHLGYTSAILRTSGY